MSSSTPPIPSGIVRATDADDRFDLVLTRTFEAPISDVWASITESARTALWFASWSGEARVGGTIRYRMTMEGDDVPEGDMTIDACEAPSHLAVTSVTDYGTWSLEAQLTGSEGITTMAFIHHLEAGADIGSIGPGWEYYLDLLVASRDGSPSPDFDDYFPSQQAYYQGLVP